jgi:hypothetical protein
MKGDLTLDEQYRSGARFVLTLPSAPRGSAPTVTISGETRAVRTV